MNGNNLKDLVKVAGSGSVSNVTLFLQTQKLGLLKEDWSYSDARTGKTRSLDADQMVFAVSSYRYPGEVWYHSLDRLPYSLVPWRAELAKQEVGQRSLIHVPDEKIRVWDSRTGNEEDGAGQITSLVFDDYEFDIKRFWEDYVLGESPDIPTTVTFFPKKLVGEGHKFTHKYISSSNLTTDFDSGDPQLAFMPESFASDLSLQK